MKKRSKTESCNIQQCFNYNTMQRALPISLQNPSCYSKKHKRKFLLCLHKVNFYSSSNRAIFQNFLSKLCPEMLLEADAGLSLVTKSS